METAWDGEVPSTLTSVLLSALTLFLLSAFSPLKRGLGVLKNNGTELTTKTHLLSLCWMPSGRWPRIDENETVFLKYLFLGAGVIV